MFFYILRSVILIACSEHFMVTKITYFLFRSYLFSNVMGNLEGSYMRNYHADIWMWGCLQTNSHKWYLFLKSILACRTTSLRHFNILVYAINLPIINVETNFHSLRIGLWSIRIAAAASTQGSTFHILIINVDFMQLWLVFFQFGIPKDFNSMQSIISCLTVHSC